MEFYKTSLGKKFYEVDFPKAVSALVKIADSLEAVSEIEKNKEKAAKVATIKENKSKRVQTVLENKTKIGLQKQILFKKISEMKDNKGEAYFDSDFLEKIIKRDEE